mmetsp:Transcript_29831/g.74626  ORF Transcript_29831/g.74626 Transcript_29831/m.74626 type:complete len:409 (-) Transcript_29831:417-1643(-)
MADDAHVWVSAGYTLLPLVIYLGGLAIWWGLRGRLWYRSTRHRWPCMWGTLPKFPPHDSRCCCFRAAHGSRKHRALRVAPCFPHNPCAVCSHPNGCGGFTAADLDLERHPCGIGMGCKFVCCGCKYTNPVLCEKFWCEDTTPEDVVPASVTTSAAASAGMSAMSAALAAGAAGLAAMGQRQQRQQRHDAPPQPAAMSRSQHYPSGPPPPLMPPTEWERQRQAHQQQQQQQQEEEEAMIQQQQQQRFLQPSHPSVPMQSATFRNDPPVVGIPVVGVPVAPPPPPPLLFAPPAAPATPTAPPLPQYPSPPSTSSTHPTGKKTATTVTPAAAAPNTMLPTAAVGASSSSLSAPTNQDRSKAAAAAAATATANAAKRGGAAMASMLGKGMQAVGKRMEEAAVTKPKPGSSSS